MSMCERECVKEKEDRRMRERERKRQRERERERKRQRERERERDSARDSVGACPCHAVRMFVLMFFLGVYFGVTC